MYVLVAIAINLVVGIVSAIGVLLGPLAVIFQMIVAALAEWFGIVFGISLLTTLYGYFAEQRPLN